jgi:thiol-disulfide isomerase/thioredoxin
MRFNFLRAWLLPAITIAFLSPSIASPGTTTENGFSSGERGGRRDSLKVGDEASPFVMRDLLTDEPTFLRDYTGKTLRDVSKNKPRNAVVISFWATWCQPCKIEIPLLTKMAQDFKGQPVKIFLVNTLEQEPSTEDTVRATYKARGYTLPCLLDASSRFSTVYTVRGLPMIVVIDKFGIVRRVNRGYHENFHIEIANLLRELVKDDSAGVKK